MSLIFPTISQSVVSTQSNTRIATVALGALLELVTVDLRPYIGKKIQVTADGKSIYGWIGAAGGEPVSPTDLIAPLNFTSGWSIVNGIGTIDDSNSLTATSGSFRVVTSTDLATVGTIVKLSITQSGTFTYIMRNNGGSSTPAVNFITSGTLYQTVIAGYLRPGVLQNSSQTSDFTALKAEVITDLAVTGAKIYSTQALSTQSWESQDVGFDANYASGFTWRIIDNQRVVL